MKKTIPLFLFAACAFQVNAQQWVTRAAEVHFLSETPIEDIEATSKEASVILDLESGRVAVQVPILSFHFEKALMEEHFNENYMESGTYPKAKFTGTLRDFGGLPESGAVEVMVDGSFEVHGVSVDRPFNGTLEKQGDQVILSCRFEVRTEDHGIPIPAVVRDNIAEVIAVDIRAELAAR
jgi:polyisoprenoid-binding protein YceI